MARRIEVSDGILARSAALSVMMVLRIFLRRRLYRLVRYIGSPILAVVSIALRARQLQSRKRSARR
jgi:hypothetical protein